MQLVRIGLASINTTVGQFSANIDRALTIAHEMAADHVTVGVFQEQLVGGYPVEDLIQWQGFVERQWPELLRFAAGTADHPAVYVLGVAVIQEGLRYNCAALVTGGRVIGLVPKEKLPTYNVFYEGRTFARGLPDYVSSVHGVPFGDLIFRTDVGLVAIEVCEDLWSADGPIRRRTYNGAELVINVSASPFRTGVVQTRREMISTRAADYQATIAYANSVGANDGLIFDGGGYVIQNGLIQLEAPRFRQGFAAVTIDLDRTARLRAENTTWRQDRDYYLRRHPALPVIAAPSASGATSAGDRASLAPAIPPSPDRSYFLPSAARPRSPREELFEDLLDALSLGIGDYYEKLGAFKQIGVSLSGGRDSLLTLLIAHRYVSRVRPDDPGALLKAFYMPSRYSSAGTRAAAEKICAELGIPLRIISIDAAFERELAIVQEMLGPDGTVTELTRQNIQARLRAQRMWNWSNSAAGLFLQTGNMSEKALGYTTIGGDLMGALAVLSNVPKTVVIALLAHLQAVTGYDGIALVTALPAGPELAANQRGEDELMPFPILDACLYLFAAEKLEPAAMLRVLTRMFPEVPAAQLDAHVTRFVRLFMQSIYKWVQSPISLHVGSLDLDRERAFQLPVVTGRAWLTSPPADN